MNSTMFNAGDILETIRMIQDECLDIRTTTMGISLLDCIDPDINKACDKAGCCLPERQSGQIRKSAAKSS